MRVVSMPTMNGGVNLRDAVTNVADNQLTAAENVWFSEGFLTTRPAFKASGNEYLLADNLSRSERFAGETKIHNDIIMTANGRTYVLVSSYISQGKNMTLCINWVSEEKDGSQDIKNVEQRGFTPPEPPSASLVLTDAQYNYFIVMHEEKLYLYLHSAGIYSGADGKETADGFKIYSCSIKDGAGFEEVVEDKLYVPTVIMNCDYDADRDGAGISGDALKSVLLDNGASLIDGYSLISPHYKMLYTQIIESDSGNADYTRKAIYGLFNSPLTDSNHIGLQIKLKYRNKNGAEFNHSVTIDGASSITEEAAGADNYRMKVEGSAVSLIDSAGNTVVLRGTDYAGSNNLEITAPWLEKKETKKLFNMTKAEWFGGASEGLNGGTRLFLGGYKGDDPEYKNLVIWSGLNNPLYFSENCYFHVGDSSVAVTAFGKQGSSLVIFKENEIYYTEYNQNTSITGEDITAQRIVDYQASAANFPLVQIHNSIGCDCPNTVQLCRNRLVWCCSTGQVYQLCTTSQYNERNVYSVGEMIERALKTESLKNAVSADWDGMYCVSCPSGNIYLMEYNSYGYQYPNSYLKEDNSNARIPWYIWNVPISEGSTDNIKHLAAIGGKLYIAETAVAQQENKIAAAVCFYYSEQGNTDDKRNDSGVYSKVKICSRMQTKIFDFGLPATKKRVPLVNISFGGNGGTPIRVSFITEEGVVNSEFVENSTSGDAYSAEYCQNEVFRPTGAPINRIGIIIGCEGRVVLNAISLNYILLGGSR